MSKKSLEQEYDELGLKWKEWLEQLIKRQKILWDCIKFLGVTINSKDTSDCSHLRPWQIEYIQKVIEKNFKWSEIKWMRLLIEKEQKELIQNLKLKRDQN